MTPANNILKPAFRSALLALDQNSRDLRKRNAFTCDKGVLFACDGSLAIEYYHRIKLPAGVAIPFELMETVVSKEVVITGFDHSPTEVAVNVRDRPAIRRPAESVEKPDVSWIWEGFPKDWLKADQFFDIVKTAMRLSSCQCVVVDGNKIESLMPSQPSMCIEYEFDTQEIQTPSGLFYDGRIINRMTGLANSVGWSPNGNLFFTDGKKFRACTTPVEKPPFKSYIHLEQETIL